MNNEWRAGSRGRGTLTGRDYAQRLRSRVDERPTWVWLATGLICGALLLVALRIDIIRMRYQVAHGLERAAQLRGEQREWVVTDRRLRQPSRLAEMAAEQGFDRPRRVVRLESAPIDEEPLPDVATAGGDRP